MEPYFGFCYSFSLLIMVVLMKAFMKMATKGSKFEAICKKVFTHDSSEVDLTVIRSDCNIPTSLYVLYLKWVSR